MTYGIDSYDAYVEELERMAKDGLVAFRIIDGKGQSGHASMGIRPFYFLIKDRDAIAARLKTVDYDRAFLQLAIAADERKDLYLMFRRAQDLGNAPAISLEHFEFQV
jgi:hypothetical protein